jgi:adenosylcobyric acid synthase
MRSQGLDAAIALHASTGRRVLGLCGGLQMLGDDLIDPHGVDGEGPGLGLLPLVTRFDPHKHLAAATMRFGLVEGAWSALSNVNAHGYEIRHGRTEFSPGASASSVLTNGQGETIGWQRGNVLGLYAHGLFESAPVLRALFGAEIKPLDAVFDGLADFIDVHFEPGSLMDLLTPTP